MLISVSYHLAFLAKVLFVVRHVTSLNATPLPALFSGLIQNTFPASSYRFILPQYLCLRLRGAITLEVL